MTAKKKLPPTHPGDVLREDFLAPMALSANRLAIELHVPVTRVTEILHRRRSVTADTALRLARFFGTSAEFWVRLQSKYDLAVAEDESAEMVAREVRPLRSA
jgi:addiction module HigA family antidote